MLQITAPTPQQPPSVPEWDVVDFLLSDVRVVRELFEDIVAAEWPPVPETPSVNSPGVTDVVGGVEKSRSTPRRTETAHQGQQQRLATEGRAQERSPPAGLAPRAALIPDGFDGGNGP